MNLNQMVVPPQGSRETEVEAVHDKVPAELHNLHNHDEGDAQEEGHGAAQSREELRPNKLNIKQSGAKCEDNKISATFTD